MAEDFCGKLGFNGSLKAINVNFTTKVCQANYNDDNDWDVWVYDWMSDARSGSLVDLTENFRWPAEVIPYAERNGGILAGILKGKNYQHIHFIAHSAGSKLIQTATNLLKEKEHVEGFTIHETFLDAYHPGKVLTEYGANADWADNHVDMRTLGTDGLDGTKLVLQHAYNIDVTPPGYDETRDEHQDCKVPVGLSSVKEHFVCRHSRPYRFYGLSIDGSFVGHPDYKQADPISSTAGMGYLLSVEASRSLENLNRVYPKGERCKVDGASCYPVVLSPGTLHYLPTAAAEVVVDGVTAAVDFVQGVGTTIYNKVTMGFAWVTSLAPQQILAVRESTTQGATTEEPSYLVVNVTTPSPVNTLRFNWRFHEAGEGLLRVFVGGNLVREIDQRHVTLSSLETEEVYIGGVSEPLPAGTHRITFRLDGFGANASGVELTDVELGLKAGPPSISTTALPTGEIAVAYTYSLLAEGGMPPYTWSLAGGKKNKLPQGLTLTSNGTLTGTPTKAKTATFTVQVTDASYALATQSLTLQIVKGVKLKTKKLGRGTVGTPYSVTLKTNGGIPPLTFSLIGGMLPRDLMLDPATGQISGTPIEAGTFDFVVQVTSIGGSTHQKQLRIKIK